MRTYQILIIDDDAADQRLYRKLLGQAGSASFQFHEALDGQAGLEALRTGTFDCVLMDFNLPGIDGLEFLSAAAVDGELPSAVVLITRQGNDVIAVEAMKRGVQDYLVKDRVNASSLLRAVTQAVSQVELRRKLAGSLRDLMAANQALEQEAAIRRAAEVELRAAKNAAEEANEAKTRFVAMMTHELRTPLNGILGYAQLLRLQSTLTVRQDTQVRSILQAGRHLLSMIDRVLDFASIETGRMVLQPEPISTRELAEACIAVVSPMASERALSLRAINAHDVPQRIVADPGRLRQVVLNLLDNAIKFTSEGGVELRMLAGRQSGGLRIEVADTGRGIGEANRERLFQDFERLGVSTAVAGTGLGLAISARFVRLMGGTIEHRPNPAGGSIFTVEMPAPALASPPTSQPEETPASPPSAQRVLLVDDIKINLDIFCGFLEAAGCTVVMAESGQEAIRLAAEQQFDLILMDVRMAEMDGVEAARRIRMLPGSHGQTPILALTAYTSLEEIGRCLDAGMNGYIPKPVDYQTLIRAIDDAIASSPVRRSAALAAASSG